jgi:hypothetical protein
MGQLFSRIAEPPFAGAYDGSRHGEIQSALAMV